MAAIPSFDFSRFQWRRSPGDPALHIREAAGAEAMFDTWSRRYNGQNTIFFGVDVSLRTSVSVDALATHVRNAWSALRFDVPTVASQILRNEEGTVFMTYRSASSSSDIDAWAQRTVRLPTPTPQSFNDLRNMLGPKPIPEDNGDQTFLYVLPRAQGTEIGFLIHTSHTPFDGGGIKTLVNRFLARLADCLGGHSGHAQLPWGQEVQNLLPSIPEAVRVEEPLSGADYDKTLAEILGDLDQGLPRQHGFKLRGTGHGPTLNLRHKFSKAQTDRIIQRTRELGLTVNQIGVNAAILLVNAFDNPPTISTPADAAFVFYSLADARDHLAPQYSGRGYPGYCLGVAVIQVPLGILPRGFMQSEEAALKALITLAVALKDEYTRARGHRSLLAVQAQLIEMVHAAIREPQPLPTPWLGSWYSGDGPGEIYIDTVHTDKEGTPVLDVQDMYASINVTDPKAVFRANSWKGMLDISVDANAVALPADVVQGFLDKWVELLLTFSVSEKRELGDETLPVCKL